MRRRIVVPVVALVLGLALPAAAGAVIIPQRGIAGIRLGMTEPQVRAVLGAPTSATVPRVPILGRIRLLRYGPLSVSLFNLQLGRVFSISTTGRSQRTARGVGVGSSESLVRARVRGVRCRTLARYRTCVIGTQLAGRVVTAFNIGRSGQVVRVSVARVID